MKWLKEIANSLLPLAFIFLCIIVLGACSSGGGSSAGSTGLSYTGLTIPAEITVDSAADISGGVLATSNLNVGALSESGQKTTSSQTLANLTQLVSKVVSDNTGDNEKHVAQAMQHGSGSFPGSCGGSVSFNGAVDEFTGEFNMDFSFKNYCDSGVTFSGPMHVTGHTNEDATVMDMIMTGTQLRVREHVSRKVFQFTNYEIYSDIYYYTMTIEIIEATFYHPDYGYVYCATLAPLVYDNYSYPSSGALYIEEDDPTPNSAILTALNSSQYQLEIDDDGDGFIDVVITDYWSSL